MARAKNRPKTKRVNSRSSKSKVSQQKLLFMEHVYELRKRLVYIATSVALFSAAAYGVQQSIVGALLRPAHEQKFIYTSPAGGIDFLFRICLYTGIAISIPVIVYHALRYIEPLLKKNSFKFIAWGSFSSGVLSLAGICFGYFIGLPSALHFLLNQFQNDQIKPLLTIQAYMSFVTIYLLGCAFLFQLPLILLFINRIKPLKPSRLFRYERWVILISVIVAGVINPSPSVKDQLLLAGPMILMYQIGIALVWFVNRRASKPRHVVELQQKDAHARAARLQQFREAQAALRQSNARLTAQAKPPPSSTALATAKSTTVPQIRKQAATARPSRPVKRRTTYLNDFTRRPYQNLQSLPDS